VTTAAIGFAGWAVFLLYATNLERLSSSVTRQIITNLKHHPDVIEHLGTPIQLPPALKFFGDPWVSGSVSISSLSSRLNIQS
jgi:cytochrome c oxidase assembly factor 1